jgi:hypothetical protein
MIMNVQLMTTERPGHIAVLALILLSSLAACTTTPKQPELSLTEAPLEIREMQTRSFDAATETQILASAIAVLQDMGYSIDEVEQELGIISASKRADATPEEKGRYVLYLLECMLSCTAWQMEPDEQLIDLTLAVFPRNSFTDSHAVRLTIQRQVWNRAGQLSLQEPIEDEQVYQDLFVKLSKSVFYEVSGL